MHAVLINDNKLEQQSMSIHSAGNGQGRGSWDMGEKGKGKRKRKRRKEIRRTMRQKQVSHLLLLLAQVEQHLWMNFEVPDSQHDGRGTGVMPGKQQVQACVLHHPNTTLSTVARNRHQHCEHAQTLRFCTVRPAYLANTNTTRLQLSVDKASHAQRN